VFHFRPNSADHDWPKHRSRGTAQRQSYLPPPADERHITGSVKYDEEPTVHPGDLAREFKERTNKHLSDELPENICDLMRRLRECERR
jgi:hypothetical protein